MKTLTLVFVLFASLARAQAPGDSARVADSAVIHSDYLQLEDYTYERAHATIPAFKVELDKDIADTKQVIENDERDYRFHYGVAWREEKSDVATTR